MSFCEKTIKKMLPKAYLRKYVAHEIYVALTFFKNLVPVMDKYVYNDGTTKDLMSLTGTIPVMISDVNYNIPICVWIEENYPQTSPICYVKPTCEMMVLTGTYLSNNGEILLPYLEDWKNGECDLMSLLQVMVAVFGEYPPVAMRPYPEHEQASCWLRCREADEHSCLSLTREDDIVYRQWMYSFDWEETPERPKTCWRDYVSRLGWDPPGIPPDKLDKAGEREVWTSLLGLLSP